MDHSSLSPLLAHLAALRRRALGLTIFSALALGLAAGLMSVLLWVLLEALFFFSPPWRTGLGILALLATGGILAFALKRHLPVLLSQHRFALFVERRCPPLQQRLISALELSDTDPSLHSPALLAAASERAAALLRAANPAQILDRQPLYAYLRLLGSATAVVLLCGALFGDDLAQAAQRCAHPLTAYERPPRTLITVRPGNLEIIKGDDATLQVHFAGDKPRRARIVRRASTEAPYQIEELVVDRADSVTYTFSQVQQSFHYAIAVGDDRSPEYEVRVIDPPAVKRLRLHYQYPAYSQLPDRIEEEGGDIQGLPGTRVALEVTANKPLSKAALVLDDTLSLAAQLDGATARIALQIERTGAYHIDLVDRKGATNRDPIRYAIQVREDQKPVVAITDPGRDSDLPESLKVLLKAEASDDFSVEEIALVYRVNNSPEQRQVLSINPQREVLVSYIWDLSAANLLPEDRIYYHLEVLDNNQVAGPQKGQSRQYVLRFPSLYELYAEADQAQEEQLSSLEELAAEGQAHQEYIERVRRELLKSEELSWEQKKELESTLAAEAERARAVEELAAELEKTIDSMQDEGTGSEELLNKLDHIRELMGDIATPEMQQALAELQKAATDPDPQALADALKRFNEDQQAFQQRLDRTIALLEQVRTEQQLRAIVEQAAELARRQSQINRELADGQSGLRQQLQEGSLQRDTERLAEQLQELSDSTAEQNPALSEQLAHRAEDVENKALSERMRQMVRQMRAKSPSAAQQTGQALAADLDALAEDLQQMQDEYLAAEKDQLSRELRHAMRDLVQLSQRQESLFGDARAQDQFALMQGTSQVVERIAAVGRRTLALAPNLSATIGYALREMHDAAQRLGQRDVRGARHPQRKAMRYLNETVLLLRESLDNLAKAQTPSAFAEAMQQLLGLSEQQSQLNQASEQAMGQMPGPSLQQQIARLSAQQQGLMQALDEIARSLRGHRGAQQRVQAIRDEVRDVLADLQRGRLTQRTRQNQERIYQRMLDASRSIHSRGFDEKRRSITATDQPYAGPTALPTDRGQTPDLWREALRQALAGPYPEEYRALLRRYYDQIYQDLQAREAP
ncbi:MAG: hypothetical protein OXH63_22590 [Gemmatimonadetes bacterium]|nr:hypothetical protein [Gemmatimonadota bacterium]